MAESGPQGTAGKTGETWPRKIRTTMEPNRDIEVGEAEYTELSRRGLIKEGK